MHFKLLYFYNLKSLKKKLKEMTSLKILKIENSKYFPYNSILVLKTKSGAWVKIPEINLIIIIFRFMCSISDSHRVGENIPKCRQEIKNAAKHRRVRFYLFIFQGLKRSPPSFLEC